MNIVLTVKSLCVIYLVTGCLYLLDRYICVTDERESVQKKTFQKWVNSHLVRVNSRIGDLYIDMRDGKNLIKLLEVLSGERLVSACFQYSHSSKYTVSKIIQLELHRNNYLLSVQVYITLLLRFLL